jgi:hypothetical protein
MASITTVERMLLSGSTHGRRIKVAATSTPGTEIHEATSGADEIDWITLYAYNAHTSVLELAIEWGDDNDPDDVTRHSISIKDGDSLIVASLPLRNGLVVRAFCAEADKITISGFVERATTE